MATCLVCVKDLVTEGTCNLICDIESEDMTSGELNKFSQIQLVVYYQYCVLIG